MSRSCVEWRGDIAACVIGALDDQAQDQVTRHLAVCARCQEDYDELIPVRDWLGLLELAGGPPRTGRASRAWPASETRPSVRSLKMRRDLRRRQRFVLAAAGAAVAAIAVAVMALQHTGAAPVRYFRAESAMGVSGRAQLHDTPTGTQIDLTASGLQGHERCILVAVTPAGTDIAGSWSATYDGSARIDGTTAFPVSQLTALRIESATGSVLLTIRV